MYSMKTLGFHTIQGTVYPLVHKVLEYMDSPGIQHFCG